VRQLGRRRQRPQSGQKGGHRVCQQRDGRDVAAPVDVDDRLAGKADEVGS